MHQPKREEGGFEFPLDKCNRLPYVSPDRKRFGHPLKRIKNAQPSFRKPY